MSPSEKAKLALELLEAPTGNYKAPAVLVPGTRELQRDGDSLSVTIPERGMEEAAAGVLEIEGLDPREWEVTGFRRSEWGEGKVSTRYTYKRRSVAVSVREPLSDADLAILLDRNSRPVNQAVWPSLDGAAALVCLGDMQFGKIESPEGDVLARMFSALDEIKRRVLEGGYSEVVIAWLGDHVEGFESQGGNNSWRTPLTLTEQIRLTRRVMLYALREFDPAYTGLPLRMAAVPGNHGEAKRFGKGVTRYDDNHDTECLISVADAAKLAGMEDVQFFVPENDDISVSLQVQDMQVVFTHGHMARQPGKLMDWVKGQAFNRDSVYANADLVVVGHFHHFYTDTSGDRTVMIAPALETESVWFKHLTGIAGNPGVLLLGIDEKKVQSVQII